MFKDWLEILTHIPENNGYPSICPECGNESIEYIYTNWLPSDLVFEL